ncbi:hypothetical protein GXW82_43545 [Streptacidiphilus sp. 4-A2]|nr:hypothetical protein [Streptacidiphilus sp. 4-A2]
MHELPDPESAQERCEGQIVRVTTTEARVLFERWCGGGHHHRAPAAPAAGPGPGPAPAARDTSQRHHQHSRSGRS